MRIRVVRPGELDDGEADSWRELRAKSGAPASPFMEPEFTLAVAGVRQDARVAVVEDEGVPAGFFPYQKGPFGHGRAIGLGVSDCQGAVLRPGLRLSARELLRACSLSVWEFDNLEAGQDLFGPGSAEEFVSPVIDVGEGYAAYERRLREQSPKFLRTTMAKERRLGRQAGEVRFVFDERDPSALRTLMAWKSAQYRRTGRRDRFAREWISALVRRLHDTRAPGCSGVLSVLYAAERPVAAHFGLRSRTVLACWFPSYDTAYARYSPGLILHLRMAEAAAAAGIGMLDLGRGAAEYKDALKTGELRVHEGSSTRPGPGAALHRLSREPGRRAHSFVRRRPRLAGYAQRTLGRIGRLRGD
ncbi:GNAT family N-acetyltransferase [Streptomyces sp. ICN441]|uniref:GNAT family N-acetyltransferase n=1 Tax=Streptomyces tirandamycinicus TaxID=2174846 RepID=A0A2S1SSL0_9ACTN|nr:MULTISPECIES: GNAT family N-acetyltransferase [Streptomyces]AWI29378.1 GNAT family N-acetyltransferase [Streptomyces tirandamycinicus]MCY0981229.1 GNAT family N-acetyltransferase [Streptomyces tirandamycinicus]TFE50198.1 GNAT family N-acetyltransferase [Streptomyces sp. ICN441]